MTSRPRHRRPWRAAIATALAAAAALAAVGAVALGLAARGEIGRAGDALADRADALAERLREPGARPGAELEAQPDAARLVGPAGRLRADGGPAGPWRAGAPGRMASLVAPDGDGWSLRDGAVEARRPVGRGTLVVRASLDGVGAPGGALWPAAAPAGLIAVLAGALAWWRAARVGTRLRAVAAAAEATAAGRPTAPPVAGTGDWRRLAEASAAAARRCGELQAAAEARAEALGAALEPLPLPVAARTPTGGLVRNEALERLVRGLEPADAAAVEEAVAAGLGAAGPVARGLALRDGRALDVEAWGVPGGRLVALGDRTEQERLAALRRQVTGAAARHLQAPVSEIQAIGSELLGQVPAATAPSVQRILAAADRMERLVGQLLRGTDHDPRARPLRTRPLGAAGIAYALGRAFDRRLRDRGLRLETEIPGDVPPVRADSALVHEILSELIANSATFTPRGGTITLAARALPGSRVELAVADTGPGIPGGEVAAVGERFARGAAAAGLPGAGLGLGVAQALAERLGGRLSVERGPGGRARLELPAASPAGGGAGDPRPELAGATAASP